MIFEFGPGFTIKNEIELTVFSDISSATFYKGQLFILSDEDHAIARLNPTTYEVEARWKFDVINPEGFFFSADGKLNIVSDDMAKVFELESDNLLN